MKKLALLFFLVPAALVINSCANEADPEADKSFFTKFYDKPVFNVSYTPLDAVQTSDGGYIVLGLKRTIEADGNNVTAPRIYLLKTDQFGEYVYDTELPETLQTPAPALLNVGGKFYFFCAEGLTTQLVEVLEGGTVGPQTAVANSAPYPLAAAVDGTDLLLLNFDVNSKETVMSVVSTAGAIKLSKAFTIGAGEGTEDPIMSHILRTGRQFPFQVGKASSGQYFFNGFYNYTMSVVFTNLNADAPLSTLQGQQDDGFITQLLSIASGKFATARTNFGDNYILPPGAMATSGQIDELQGLSFPELVPFAPVKIISTKVGDTDKVIYGSNTRGKQIVLLAYNSTDGSFAGSRYLGFSNTFELASMVPTADNGLLVVGTTYIAGRFPRICLFKLSAEALSESFQK